MEDALSGAAVAIEQSVEKAKVKATPLSSRPSLWPPSPTAVPILSSSNRTCSVHVLCYSLPIPHLLFMRFLSSSLPSKCAEKPAGDSCPANECQ